MPKDKGNLFSRPQGNLKEEFFETLAETEDFRLERIVSLGHVTEAGTWLKEEDNEWVVLIRGEARLRFEGDDDPVTLAPGDHVFIPKGKRHKVEWTDPEETSVWLALHYPAKARDGFEDFMVRRVEVSRSPYRRKSIRARMVKGTLLVEVPLKIDDRIIERAVEKLKVRFQHQRLKRHLDRNVDLAKIAQGLNKKYFDGILHIRSIEYVTDQYRKFAVCNCSSGHIRISHKISLMPSWVRDYVIVHEMAHLVHPNHGKAFWEMVNQYPQTERARGYLLAIGMETEGNIP